MCREIRRHGVHISVFGLVFYWHQDSSRDLGTSPSRMCSNIATQHTQSVSRIGPSRNILKCYGVTVALQQNTVSITAVRD